MEKKQQLFQIQGIQQDLSVNNFSPKYAFNLHNLRISIDKESSLLCLTKEQDLKSIKLLRNVDSITINNENIEFNEDLGDIIGVQKIEDKIVVFSIYSTETINFSCIWVLYEGKELIPNYEIGFYEIAEDSNSLTLWNNELRANLLYIGNLNFNFDYPIKSIAYKENDESQKVYWVDGLNPCRCININKVYKYGELESNYTIANSQFDFNKIIDSLEDEITVTKTLGVGSFTAGVIQYCYTYFNKYENETPIINYSSLNYISTSQGIANDKTVTCSFNINIKNINPNYEYLRLYALERTSLNGTIKCRLVKEVTLDKPLNNRPQKNYITISDTGTIGESYDFTKLLFLNNGNIIANTIYEKDNTLFLGNYKKDTKHYLSNKEKDLISTYLNENLSLCFKKNESNNISIKELTDYKGLLNHSSDEILTFKKGETYRIGIQFQFNTGELSEVIYLQDLKNEVLNEFVNGNYNLSYISFNEFTLMFNVLNNINDEVLKEKLKNVSRFRLMMVEPTTNDWSCFGQGLLTPCIYNPIMRLQQQSEAMADYLVRSFLPTSNNKNSEPISIKNRFNTSGLTYNDYTHHDIIFNECQNNVTIDHEKEQNPLTEIANYDKYANLYFYPLEHSLYKNGAMVNNSSHLLNRIKVKDIISEKLTNISPNLFGIKISLNETINSSKTKITNSYISLLPIIVSYDDMTHDATTSPFKITYTLEFLNTNSAFISIPIEEAPVISNYKYKTIKFITGLPTPDFNQETITVDFLNQIKPHFNGTEKAYQQFDIALDKILQYIDKKDRFLVAYMAWESLLKNNYNENTDNSINHFNFKKVLSAVTEKNKTNNNNDKDTIEDIITVGLDYDTIVKDSTLINKIDFSIYNDVFVRDNQYYNIYTPEINFLNFLDKQDDIQIQPIKLLQKNSLKYDVNIDLKNIYRNTYYGKILGVSNPWFSENVLTSFLYIKDYLPVASIKDWGGANDGSGPEDNIMWDANSSTKKSSARARGAMGSYRTYLWNRKFLNSDISSVIDNKDTITGLTELNSKIISNILDLGETSLPINILNSFKSYIRIVNNSVDKYSFNGKIYNCNTDLLYKGSYNLIGKMQEAPKIGNTFMQYAYSAKNEGAENNYITLGIPVAASPYNSNMAIASSISRNDVIPIKYKTTSHLLVKDENRELLSLIHDSFKEEVSPVLWINTNINKQIYLLYDYNNFIEHKGERPNDLNYPIVEIQRIPTNQYGGKWSSHSDYVGTHSTWIPISKLYPVNIFLNTIQAQQGDTYFQKATILKSFPYTNKDINQNINVASFFVESRINLDGRTDDINKTNYLNINDTNFNLINDVYSQHNNFFSYSSPESENLNNFPYQILISNTKQSGTLIDTFQHINYNSFVDLNPLYGSLTSINSINDILLAIQDEAISRINFNSRIQIATNDGTPVEFKNSEKVDGFTVLSDCYGTSNYNTIIKTKHGLYFIDTKTKTLINFTGEVNNVSTTKGMQSWFKKGSIQNFKCVYDDYNEDLYILDNNRATGENCLCFNEALNTFVGFFDYSDTAYLKTLRNFPIIFNTSYNFYNLNSNKKTYNDKSYSITLIANENFQFDKIFDTINFRTSYKEEISLVNTSNNKPFNFIATSNDYQSIQHNANRAREKFRVWRYPLRNDNQFIARDRIRNNWSKITLTGDYKKYIQFYDFDVTYYLP